jgi:hypothetical protein
VSATGSGLRTEVVRVRYQVKVVISSHEWSQRRGRGRVTHSEDWLDAELRRGLNEDIAVFVRWAGLKANVASLSLSAPPSLLALKEFRRLLY